MVLHIRRNIKNKKIKTEAYLRVFLSAFYGRGSLDMEYELND